MTEDLKDLRDQFQADVDEWADPRKERAKDLRYLAGDPWEQADKDARFAAGRPYLAFDELNQYVNQVVNDLRANPRAIAFAPGDDEDPDPTISTKRAQLYADKTREIEYRSNAKMAYTLAAENAIQGGYGAVRVTSKYAPKSVRNQELWIEAVPDPDCVVLDPFHRNPDGSDIQRGFVLEHRRIPLFKDQFPKAKIRDFDAYQADASYKNWVQPDRILLAEYWRVVNTKRRLLVAQPPAATPPPGQMNMRAPVTPPVVELWADDWKDANLPPGTTILDEREADDPSVVMQLVNGVEILEETPWDGSIIPIIPCYGRVLYTPDGVDGRAKRLLMSMIRLARDPYMAYCYAATGAVEVSGATTKNPYWAYEGQLSAAQLKEIQKSLHEPVAVLLSKFRTPEMTPGQNFPLPQRNSLDVDLGGWSVLMENHRRAIQAAIAANFLPSQAQRRNEKSGKALERIEQSAQKGTFHFIDHYEGMIRQTGVVIEDVFDKKYDAKRKISIRKADDTAATVWINDPQNPESIDVKGRHTVTVSSGPDFDSTREAASDFADTLIQAKDLLAMLGPAKATKLVALAIKLKVRETGIGAIGQQIVDIIDPPQDEQLSPEQLQQQNVELQGQLEQATQLVQQLRQEVETGLAKEREKTSRDQLLADIQGRIDAALIKIKGDEAIRLQQAKDAGALAKQDDAQRHDLGMHAVESEHDKAQTKVAMLATMATPESGGTHGSGASA